jgi:hypothetical protein
VAFAIDYTGNVTLTAGLPTLVYVDDLWAGSTPGQTVSSGSYTGTFGYNAFATISTGVAGVATTGLVGVIEGLYNESITVSRDVTIEGIQPAVPTTEMGAAAGAAMLDGTGLFTAAITASGAGIDLIVVGRPHDFRPLGDYERVLVRASSRLAARLSPGTGSNPEPPQG